MFTRETHATYTPEALVQAVWKAPLWKKNFHATMEHLFHGEDTDTVVDKFTVSFYETVETLDIDTNAVENVQQLDGALATLLNQLELKFRQIVDT